MDELHPHTDERTFRADVTSTLKRLLAELDEVDSADLDPRLVKCQAFIDALSHSSRGGVC